MFAVLAATPPFPALSRPPQTNHADNTVDPAGRARSALVELVVDASVSASMNAIAHSLLFRLSVLPVPPRAAAQPLDALGQLSWLLPVSAIAPLSCALNTAVNGSRTAA